MGRKVRGKMFKKDNGKMQSDKILVCKQTSQIKRWTGTKERKGNEKIHGEGNVGKQ